jgi:hypothetical protein
MRLVAPHGMLCCNALQASLRHMLPRATSGRPRTPLAVLIPTPSTSGGVCTGTLSMLNPTPASHPPSHHGLFPTHTNQVLWHHHQPAMYGVPQAGNVVCSLPNSLLSISTCMDTSFCWHVHQAPIKNPCTISSVTLCMPNRSCWVNAYECCAVCSALRFGIAGGFEVLAANLKCDLCNNVLLQPFDWGSPIDGNRRGCLEPRSHCPFLGVLQS